MVHARQVNSLSEHYSRIFLLSHMRAFTSLAGHILGSHPRINGYYEMHVSYDNAQALQKQIELYCEHDVLKPGSRYFFDKLLHNEYALQLDQLNIFDSKILITLREPEQTIRSIVSLFMKKDLNDLYASFAGATQYYIDRLTWLAEFCRNAQQGYFYFDAEILKSRPEKLLPGLTAWLGLDSPLVERYEVFSQTGMARKGDTSENIHSGIINKDPHDYSSMVIPAEQLLRARHAYEVCRQQLLCNTADHVTR
jgi:hypothetical protein